MFEVFNHNNTSLGEFDNLKDAEKDRDLYIRETGNAAYIENHSEEFSTETEIKVAVAELKTDLNLSDEEISIREASFHAETERLKQ